MALQPIAFAAPSPMSFWLRSSTSNFFYIEFAPKVFAPKSRMEFDSNWIFRRFSQQVFSEVALMPLSDILLEFSISSYNFFQVLLFAIAIAPSSDMIFFDKSSFLRFIHFTFLPIIFTPWEPKFLALRSNSVICSIMWPDSYSMRRKSCLLELQNELPTKKKNSSYNFFWEFFVSSGNKAQIFISYHISLRQLRFLPHHELWNAWNGNILEIDIKFSRL